MIAGWDAEVAIAAGVGQRGVGGRGAELGVYTEILTIDADQAQAIRLGIEIDGRRVRPPSKLVVSVAIVLARPLTGSIS